MQGPVDKSRHRAIRSYVLRAGRITPGQQRGLDAHWSRFGVDFEPQALDLARLFGRIAACTLEIGFGNGEHLLERALAQPDHDFLGVEVHRPGIGHLLLAAAHAGVHALEQAIFYSASDQLGRDVIVLSICALVALGLGVLAMRRGIAS